MSDIDWSKAPEGATHRIATGGSVPWRKFTSNGDFWHDGSAWLKFRRDVEVEYIARPDLQPLHADDLAVEAFSQAMARRLVRCRAAGRSGWDDPEQCPPQRLAEGLVRAVHKCDLIDVANYAAMLLARSKSDGLPEHTVHALLVAALGRTAGDPAPVEWDGTGLPPVGTVCEWFVVKGAPWEQVTIAANVRGRSGAHYVLFKRSAGAWHWESDPKRLRPILTPEQRAAKERDEAVAAMLALDPYDPRSGTGLTSREHFCGVLYDAGYVKRTED